MAHEKPAHDATIFVVDDDDGMRRALGTLLSTVGYKTALFALPSEFLARFKGDDPGCLILDIRMPEPGWALAREQCVQLESFPYRSAKRCNIAPVAPGCPTRAAAPRCR